MKGKSSAGVMQHDTSSFTNFPATHSKAISTDDILRINFPKIDGTLQAGVIFGSPKLFTLVSYAFDGYNKMYI